MGLSLISIGLSDEMDMSLRALDEARSCDALYLEQYTTVLETDIERLRQVTGRQIQLLKRSDLEEDSEKILQEAQRMKVGLLVGGDCLTATTHVTLIVEAAKLGIKTNTIHGSSILTAIAETGLSPYSFGKPVTIPFRTDGIPVKSPYRVLQENLMRGLHTLFLLDIDTENRRYLTAPLAIRQLLDIEAEEVDGAFTKDTFTVAAARLGSDSRSIVAGKAKDLAEQSLGPPPHILIVPGRLHFTEEEALQVLTGCSREEIRGRTVHVENLEARTRKYIASCEKALRELKPSQLPRTVEDNKLRELLGYAETYLADSKHYVEAGKHASALASVGYSEGILDALRLLKLAEFEW